jgi:hypothetical protein
LAKAVGPTLAAIVDGGKLPLVPCTLAAFCDGGQVWGRPPWPMAARV